MKILVLLSHPAQFLFYKNAITELRERGHQFFILIKTKDVLSTLLTEAGWEYYNILPKERGKSKFQIVWGLILRDIRVFRFARKNSVNLLMGSDASLAHAGRLLGVPSITTLEDDYAVIKSLAWLTFPFSSKILTPNICDIGRWKYKKIGYEGYMKLAYLHPKWFGPDRKKVTIGANRPYYIIRLSGLSAHHDFGIKGISSELLNRLVTLLSATGRVYISSEKVLPHKYDRYLLKISASDIHHYLYYSEILICDSQSMAMEAAMLGVPSVRISSFAGKISVLEELELKYKLTFGFSPQKEIEIMKKVEDFLNTSNLKEVFQNRRKTMLSEKIDVSEYLIKLIGSYPKADQQD